MKNLCVFSLLACGLSLLGCNSDPAPSTEPEASGEAAEVSEETGPNEGDLPAPDDVAAVPEGTESAESGLAWRVLQAGTGERHPAATDQVKVHYTGWTTDGRMFDSSVVRGEPSVFPLNRVIAGWTEGVQLMVEGEKRRFWIPEALAYQGRRDPRGMLVFDVELVQIMSIPAPDDVAAPPEGASELEGGLKYIELTPGSGEETITDDDRVTIHVTGWSADGVMLISTRLRGQPMTNPVARLMPAWMAAVKQMSPGAKWRIWAPEALTYQGRPGAPAGQLTFEIELVAVQRPIPAPADVAAAPSDATTIESGLAFKVLTAGTGSEHPTATSNVKVHYTGWTSDGAMFDSSLQRGEPATLNLARVIPGWTEGVQLMVTGEKRRFWIPESLAYGGRSGAPAGTLVFEVELLEILAASAAPAATAR